MFTSEQLLQLANFHSERFPLSTFYWETPKAANRSHHNDSIEIQNLLREARRQFGEVSHGREWLHSAEADQNKILHYFTANPETLHAHTAIFCCSGESFWQPLHLPRGLRSGFFVGETFYLQPLTVLLDQYHRYCAIVVDRQSARIFEIYMGEIEEHTSFLDEVPGRIKAATWTGGNERQIERRIENKAHQHYKRTVEVALEFFRKYHFDWLILGGHSEGISSLENHLHSDLGSRLIGRFPADVKTVTTQEILAKSTEIAEAQDRREKAGLVEEIANRASQGGLGVIGLSETLRALALGEVHTLVVEENLEVSASICSNCGWVAAEKATVCALCKGALQNLENAAERAVELAIQDSSQIRFVTGNDPLRQAGGMAALLRFRAQESQPESVP
ncbi:MAG: hypothetical protein HY647_04415 [Acidobacteria bacterium]|nr:hypothetical protein [Acidobacteriota bacterium]